MSTRTLELIRKPQVLYVGGGDRHGRGAGKKTAGFRVRSVEPPHPDTGFLREWDINLYSAKTEPGLRVKLGLDKEEWTKLLSEMEDLEAP